MTDYYVPGTEETDLKKVIMSLQQTAGNTATNTTNTATNTANIATNTTNIAALQALSSCGYFIFLSSTLVQFQPFNGSLIKIAGAIYQIPGGSISGNNTGTFVNGVGASNLAASTLYYVYVFNNAGTLTIDFSTTGYTISTTAGNVGTVIKTGGDTRTLVGMVFTNGSNQFVIENTISWLNKKARQVAATSTATSGNIAQVEFTTWPDEAISFDLNAAMANASAGGLLQQRLFLDGAGVGVTTRNDNVAATGSSSVAISGTKLLSAGRHTIAQSIATTGTPSAAQIETYVAFRG